MASLKIQVLGKGLIPRGLGIAPRKAPFPADLTLIQTILNTPGLKVRMVHPQTGQFMNVTNATLSRLWAKYADMPVQAPTAPVAKRPVKDATDNGPIAPAPPANQIPPAAATMVKEAVNAAANEVFGTNTQQPETKKDEEVKQEQPAGTHKPYVPNGEKNRNNGNNNNVKK